MADVVRGTARAGHRRRRQPDGADAGRAAGLVPGPLALAWYDTSLLRTPAHGVVPHLARPPLLRRSPWMGNPSRWCGKSTGAWKPFACSSRYAKADQGPVRPRGSASITQAVHAGLARPCRRC